MTSKELAGLIRQHTRVILPEFGAFLVKESADKEFSPQNVSFSPFLRYNDGMLEVHVSKSQSISKDEAFKIVKSYVEQIKSELIDKGFYTIEGLGYLKRDARGSVTFVVGEAMGEKSESTKGKKVTDPVTDTPQIPTAEQEKKTEKIEKPTESQPVTEKLSVTGQGKKTEDVQIETPRESPRVVAKEEPALERGSSAKETPKPTIKPEREKPTVEKMTVSRTQMSTTSYKPTDSETHSYQKSTAEILIEQHTQKSNQWLIPVLIIAAVAVVVTFAILIKIYVFDQSDTEFSQDTSSPERIELKAEPTKQAATGMEKPKDEIDKSFEELASKSDANATKEKERAVEEQIKNELIASTKIVQNLKGNFHIVAGSFKSKANADNYSETLRKQGYASVVIEQASGMYAVTAGSYGTRADAIAALNTQKEKFPNAWLLKH
jgi:hypothetical protein